MPNSLPPQPKYPSTETCVAIMESAVAIIRSSEYSPAQKDAALAAHAKAMENLIQIYYDEKAKLPK